MTDKAAETECVEEFLQRAKFWRSIAVWLPFRDSVPGPCAYTDISSGAQGP